jgi:hypothetical protein
MTREAPRLVGRSSGVPRLSRCLAYDVTPTESIYQLSQEFMRGHVARRDDPVSPGGWVRLRPNPGLRHSPALWREPT